MFKIQFRLAEQELKLIGENLMFSFNPDGWIHQIVIYETIRRYLGLEVTHVTTHEQLKTITEGPTEQEIIVIPYIIVSRRASYTHYIVFIDINSKYKGFDIINPTPDCDGIEDIMTKYLLKEYEYHVVMKTTKDIPPIDLSALAITESPAKENSTTKTNTGKSQ